MNIVSNTTSAIGPAVIDKIARSLDMSGTLARSAVNIAVPAIMAALAGKGSSVQGAGSILGKVAGRGMDGLDTLDAILDDEDRGRRVDTGNRDLVSVLGGNETGPVMKAVGRFTGIGEEKSSALLGMLAPVALGTLGREASSRNLDAEGLYRLLTEQRENIVDALPDGFIDHVPGSRAVAALRSGLVDGGADSGRSPDPDPLPGARGSGGAVGWILGLSVALAIGWLIAMALSGPRNTDVPAKPFEILGLPETGLAATIRSLRSPAHMVRPWRKSL